MTVQYLSIIFLILASVISIIDGLYFHLFKLNLQFHPETRKEHLLHSFRALFFTLVVAILFYGNAQGSWLIFGLLIAGVDFVIEVLDILEEGKSRKQFNGLSNNEYLLHALAITFRSLSYGLWFSIYAADHLFLENTKFTFHQNGWISFLLLQIAISSSLVTFIHFYLVFRPRMINLTFCNFCKLQISR